MTDASTATSTAPAAHPLDPLSADEIRAVTAVLRRDRGVDERWRYASIELKEPAKDVSRSFDAAPDVASDQPSIQRRARVVLWDRGDGTAYKAVVSVTDRTGEARYPSFKAIMASKKKPITTWTLADLGIEPSRVGAAGAATVVRTAAPQPPRQAGEVIVDEGDAAVRIADFLVAQKLL